MNEVQTQTCQNCKYLNDEVCCNDQSDWLADFTNADDSCEELEEKR